MAISFELIKKTQLELKPEKPVLAKFIEPVIIDELSKIPIYTITADILSAKTFDSIYEAYYIYRAHYIDLMVDNAYESYNFDYDINKPIIEQYEVVTVPKQYLDELIVNKKEK